MCVDCILIRGPARHFLRAYLRRHRQKQRRRRGTVSLRASRFYSKNSFFTPWILVLFLCCFSGYLFSCWLFLIKKAEVNKQFIVCSSLNGGFIISKLKLYSISSGDLLIEKAGKFQFTLRKCPSLFFHFTPLFVGLLFWALFVYGIYAWGSNFWAEQMFFDKWFSCVFERSSTLLFIQGCSIQKNFI